MMEGTVTISLKEYKSHYFVAAVKQVELLEKVEEVLKVEGIETELLTEISEALEDWYG